jgi:nuclear pore complex protein Nup98-Nup96
MTRLPELLKSLHESSRAVPDASEASELEEFSRAIPRLVGLVPDILRDRTDPRQEAASAEMSRGLLSSLDRIKPLALATLSNISHADEASKLNHIRSRAMANFMRSVEVAAAV